MESYKITIILNDGDLNGIRDAKISMSTIRAIAFRRDQIGEIPEKLKNVITKTSVYILVNQEERRAYIGESNNVLRRLQDHKKKEFWNEVIVLINTDNDDFTKDHALYVESQFISRAEKNPEWNLKNDKLNKKPNLSEFDTKNMDKFSNQAYILVDCLGYDLFRDKLSSNRQSSKNTPIFYFQSEGFDAQMTLGNSGEAIVSKGSKARIRETNTLPGKAKDARRMLLDKGVLSESDGAYIFTSNYTFSSPYFAAIVVCGRSENGRTAWVRDNGQTYHDWDDEKLNKESGSGKS